MLFMPSKKELQLSIILPIYNVEPYLEKCIKSLQNQDIAKEENQGVSVARNNGIEIAKGKYILFVDPDDFILPNTLLRIIQKAEIENVDLLYLGFTILSIKGEDEWKTNYDEFESLIVDGVEGYFSSRGIQVRDPDASVAKLYRSAFLEKYALSYPKGVPYLEDGLFLIKVFSVANKVGFLNMNFYQRTTRPGSATQSSLFYTDKAIKGFINAAINLREFENQNNLLKYQKELINHGLAKFVILSLSPSIYKFKFFKYIEIIKLLKKHKLTQLETEGLKFVYKKHAKMYNFSKLFFPFFFRLNNKL